MLPAAVIDNEAADPEDLEPEADKIEFVYDASSKGEYEMPPESIQYAEAFQKLATVERYEGSLPNNFINDTSLDHTLRCVARFSELFPIDAQSGQKRSAPLAAGIRMLYIHDIGESEVGDNNAVEGKKPADHKTAEREVAQRILTKPDFYLYELFEKVSLYLNGEGDERLGQTPFERAGVLAKLIDSIDSNLFFHRAFSRWIRDGNSIEEIPLEYIEWTFKQYIRYKDKFADINAPASEKQFWVGLLDAQIHEIKSMWDDANPMPQVLAEKLALIEPVVSK